VWPVGLPEEEIRVSALTLFSPITLRAPLPPGIPSLMQVVGPFVRSHSFIPLPFLLKARRSSPPRCRGVHVSRSPRRGFFLLIERRRSPPRYGRWTFFGGLSPSLIPVDRRVVRPADSDFLAREVSPEKDLFLFPFSGRFFA